MSFLQIYLSVCSNVGEFYYLQCLFSTCMNRCVNRLQWHEQVTV